MEFNIGKDNITTVQRLPLSVVIITLNEEKHLARCLENLPLCAEIIILDSGSTDKTVEIARSFNANIYFRDFDNFAAQKNAALAKATQKWILSLDADEVCDFALKVQIGQVCSHLSEANCVYRLRRQLVFLGRKMRFGKTADQPIRLFQNGQAIFQNSIHEKLSTNLPVKTLQGILWHYSYDNLTDYLNRFNRYTSEVANQHFTKKRRFYFIKHIIRPWFEFINRYFIRLGFLDGYPGYCFALLSSFYAYMKYAKLYERYLQDS